MREEQKAYIRKLYMQVRQAEAQMRDRPMPALTKEDFFLFRETGNRLVYENAYFGRRKYLTVYAILALWGGELSCMGIVDEETRAPAADACIRRLEEILVSICREERFWALPAHVDFDRIDLPETAYTVDLFAAETAQALSEIALRLYDRLSCETVACVAREVVRRVLYPFASSPFPYSWWETDRCNWSAVCAGSVGMAAINMDALNRRLMESYMPGSRGKDDPVPQGVLLYRDEYGRLPQGWKDGCLRRACAALQCYLDGMEADGACTEGLGYYNYGMSFYAAFAEQYGADGGDGAGRLMYREKCEQIALFQQKCYFKSRHGGVSISFSDGSRHESFLPGLTAYLKYCYPQVETPDYALARPFDEDACYRYLTNERNISWLIRYEGSGTCADMDTARTGHACSGGGTHVMQDPSGTRDGAGSLADRCTAYLLPEAQWLICQDGDGNGFAAKGGNNDENHNHNDIGHFLCVFQGEMLLCDFGAGEYTKDYFGDRRYDILCNRSMGHSVPLVNGEEQCAGAGYSADRFVWDRETLTLTISFAGAYPGGCIGELVRHIRLCVPPHADMAEAQSRMQVELYDVFAANDNTRSITENIVTEYEPVVRDGLVWIRGQHGQCSIQAWDGMGDAVRIIPCAHSDHAGNRRTVYRIAWEVPVEEDAVTGCKMWITFYDNEVFA